METSLSTIKKDLGNTVKTPFLLENDELVAQINRLSSIIKDQHKVNRNTLAKINELNHTMSDELLLAKTNINEIYNQVNTNRIFNKVIREQLNSTIERLEILSDMRRETNTYLKQSDDNYSIFYDNAKNIFKSMKILHLTAKSNRLDHNSKSRERQTFSQKIRKNYLVNPDTHHDSRSQSTTQRIIIKPGFLSTASSKTRLK